MMIWPTLLTVTTARADCDAGASRIMIMISHDQKCNMVRNVGYTLGLTTTPAPSQVRWNMFEIEALQGSWRPKRARGVDRECERRPSAGRGGVRAARLPSQLAAVSIGAGACSRARCEIIGA